MKLDEKTTAIIRTVESIGYRVDVHRVKGRTTITATASDGDEEIGCAATPHAAAMQLLAEVMLRGKRPA